MDVTIGPEFRERDVDVTLGVMRFSVSSPIGNGAASAALEGLAKRLAPQFETMKPAELASVAATRKAYRALGKDPGRYRPSSEALLRRIASGKSLPQINDVVDVGNVISLSNCLSLGAYNADQIEGDVIFRRAGDGETADAIGRGTMNFEHLPVFADDISPFGSPTSDTERTMVTPQAENILMVLIAFERDEEMDVQLADAGEVLEQLCGALGISARVVQNW